MTPHDPAALSDATAMDDAQTMRRDALVITDFHLHVVCPCGAHLLFNDRDGAHRVCPYCARRIAVQLNAFAQKPIQEASMPRSDAERPAHEESPQQPPESNRTGDPGASRERIRLTLIDLARLAESCGWEFTLDSGMSGRWKTYELKVYESAQPGGDET